MDFKQAIEQVFANNMGNRITPELAAGMVRSIALAIAASLETSKADAAAQEAACAYYHEKEKEDGMA